MRANSFIFPGLLVGIVGLIGVTSLLGAPPAGVSGFAPQAQAPGAGEYFPYFISECSISDSYPDAILQWCGLIEKYAVENGVDPNLVSAIMFQESAGRPDAYSKSGAVGLMQVMPRDGKAAKFACKNGPCFADRPSMNELFDPEYNVGYGVQMLANLIRQHGDLREALRAYGPEDVGYYYADIVINIMNNHP